ncbi:MAG: hypothetical protein DHS20C15_13800 [Planctomycetota bacterium]|nr:MAG: hypothetical protein DHS20C15_13800 [Planctomycetota bacterium]
MPTGTVEMILNYGDPIVHLEPGGVQSLPRFYVSGQRTRAVHPFVGGRVGLLVVSLYPWALRELFPGCVGALDCYADLEQLVVRSRLEAFVELFDAAVDEAGRTHAAFALLEQLASDASDARVPMVRAAVQRLVHDAGRTRVSELAEAFGVSGRHFTRRFRAQVGLAPKHFARVMRFQRALRHCRAGTQGLAQIATHCGYVDQSHMSHELLELGGRTPSEIVERARADNSVLGAGSTIFECVYL